MFKWFRRAKSASVAMPGERKSALDAIQPGGKRPVNRGGARFSDFLSKLPEAHARATGHSSAAAMDSALPTLKQGFANNGAAIANDALLGWFTENTFIGYPLAAIIAQNWLVDKAMSMPARDAIRHGFDVTFAGVNDETKQAELQDEVDKANKEFNLSENIYEFIRMGRVFGIRLAMFDIDVTDRDTFYENPFNIDALSEKTRLKGIVQIDQNWVSPILNANTLNNPADPSYYTPEWWLVGGKKIHKSHFVEFMPYPVPDLLKPMYQYGGVPLPQRIMERVYAAERTANEAPQLAMSKRLTHWQTNLADVVANPEKFAQMLYEMQEYRDNYGVKISDSDDTLTQFDTSLADLDTVIMTQYQIVAAIAGVPVTKLMGTVPKGFNSTGEFEMKSYHEELETVQSSYAQPLVERYLQILGRTRLAPLAKIDPDELDPSIDWAPVDSPTAKEYAEINKLKAETDNTLQLTGAIDGMDIRARLSRDKNSEYTDLPDPEPEDIDNDPNVSTQDPPAVEADPTAPVVPASGEPT